MPFISVVIPLYNKEKQIKRTIDSVLNQGFDDFEVIIINDGSTDNSLNIVEEIRDTRIRIITQQNSGVSAARNRGIKEALGKYILLLDADDCLLSGALDLPMENTNFDIIIGSFHQVNSDGIITRKSYNCTKGVVGNPYKSYCKKDIYVRIGNFFVKKEYLLKKGLLRTDLTLYEDEEWILRLLEGSNLFSSEKIILEYIRVKGGLSYGFKPIEKEWAYFASVNKISDKYKREIIGDFVFRRFVIRLKRKDWHGVNVIWNNNKWRMLYCFVAFFRRAQRGGFIKNYIREHRYSRY